jgi:hypothetical protein
LSVVSYQFSVKAKPKTKGGEALLASSPPYVNRIAIPATNPDSLRRFIFPFDSETCAELAVFEGLTRKFPDREKL